MGFMFALLVVTAAMAVASAEIVDSEGWVGEYTSIALDSQGFPHISYYDGTNRNLKYAYYDGLNWHIRTVCEGGKFTSIALDSQGYPHISYYDDDNLKYAHKHTYGWSFETVDGERRVELYESLYTSIALDSQGYPHISYYNATNGDLKYAYKDASGWHIETVDSAGFVEGFSSIALDSQGYPHISYYDNTNKDLKYAYKDASGWHIETVDSEGWVGLFTSIALDSNDNPHISYYDDTNGDLKYTTKQPTIVNLQGGITDSNGDPVATASMRVTIKNVDGNVVYQETLNDVIENGKFNVLLGATQKLELWEDAAYNLVIEVDVDSTTFSQADITFGDDTPAGDVIVFYP